MKQASIPISPKFANLLVRTNAFELHIKDASFYRELFDFSPYLDKRGFQTGKERGIWRLARLTGVLDTGSLEWTARNDLHQLRRHP